LEVENRWVTLGLVGSLGLLGLLGVPFYRGEVPKVLLFTSALCYFLLALMFIGGLGSLFNLLISPQVRAYNRVSIFLALLTLTTIASWIELSRYRWLLASLGIAIGIMDQSPKPWFRDQADASRLEEIPIFQQDAEFFGQSERTQPGEMVFALPYGGYPEHYATPLPGGYTHVRGYLHTKTVRWIYGAMMGREVDQWYRETLILPPEEMLFQVIAKGYTGLFLDGRGIPEAELTAIREQLGEPTFRHPDDRQIYYDLRRYAETLPQNELAQARERQATQVRMLWFSGWQSFNPLGQEDLHRWCGREGRAYLVNPTKENRTVEVRGVFGSANQAHTTIIIDGPGLSPTTIYANRFPMPEVLRFTVPPGHHRVTFRATPPPEFVREGYREDVFFFAQIKIKSE
jgi:hypothetical protein